MANPIPRLAPETLAGWRRHLTLYRKACIAANASRDMRDVVELDVDFHRSIVALRDDADLMAIWTPIMGQLTLPYSRHDDLLESWREHRAIVDAARAGDAAAASAALRANIR